MSLFFTWRQLQGPLLQYSCENDINGRRTFVTPKKISRLREKSNADGKNQKLLSPVMYINKDGHNNYAGVRLLKISNKKSVQNK